MGTVVDEWLQSIEYPEYQQAFYDNGYDDLECCKKISNSDLEVIGVHNPSHRSEILKAIACLNDDTGRVYFSVNPTSNITEGANYYQDQQQPANNSEKTMVIQQRFPYPKTFAVDSDIQELILEQLKSDNLLPSSLHTFPREYKGDEVDCLEDLALIYSEDLNINYSCVLFSLQKIQRSHCTSLAFIPTLPDDESQLEMYELSRTIALPNSRSRSETVTRSPKKGLRRILCKSLLGLGKRDADLKTVDLTDVNTSLRAFDLSNTLPKNHPDSRNKKLLRRARTTSASSLGSGCSSLSNLRTLSSHGGDDTLSHNSGDSSAYLL